MAKRLKTGIVALGLGILLGLNTPVIAKDTKEPETKTVQEEQPSLAYPVIQEHLAYETRTIQNDNETIKMEINYKQIALLGNHVIANEESLILTGKKDKGSINLEEMRRSDTQSESYKTHKKNEINPFFKILAEKILTEKAYKENSEPSELIYGLFDALNTEIKII